MKDEITKFDENRLKVPKPQEFEYPTREDIERRMQGRNEMIQINTKNNENLEAENVKDQALLEKATEFNLKPVNNVFAPLEALENVEK